MTSTLKRTITDIMEDELYAPAFNDKSQQQQQQMSIDLPASQQSQNDFLQYLSLPNASQDSLQKMTESENQVTDHNGTNNGTNTNNNTTAAYGNSPMSNLDGIYNSYGDPNLYTNPQLLDYLFNNTNNDTNSQNMVDEDGIIINPQITNVDDHPYNYIPHHGQAYANVNNNSSSSPPVDDAQDDILMIPQDNYFVYDHQDPQFIPEMLQMELSNKSFPQSNELNIFKANDVLYEFSDDEDEDDDIDLQNKLDDDMEMKLDDDDSSYDDDSSCAGESLGDAENDNANNYIAANDNSIYSLTVPNQFNSISLPSLNQNQYSQQPTPLTSFNNIDFYASDDDDEEEDDHGVVDDDEEEEDDFAIDMDTDGDLYTSAFQERKESVIGEARPLVKKERTSSSRPTTRPKRYNRRASTHISAAPNLPSSLRKPRVKDTNTNGNDFATDAVDDAVTATIDHDTNNNSIGLADGYDSKDEEEHVCTIPNPKTGKPCLKKFSRPYDLVRHQNTIHASKRSFYRCMFCEDDLRRKHDLESVNMVVVTCKYRNTQFSRDNSLSHITSSHNVKKIKSGALNNSGYLSNKTFSRCDALTRHLRFRHGLNNNQVVDAMDFAKKNVEFYDN